MKNQDERIKQFMEFIRTCTKALEGKPCDTIVEFTCPICGRTAKGLKVSYNGHCRGGCECGMRFMQ